MVRQATQSRAAREEKGERAEERGDRQTKCEVKGGEERVAATWASVGPARAFPRWETSALPRAWVSGWRSASRGDAAGEERKGLT